MLFSVFSSVCHQRSKNNMAVKPGGVSVMINIRDLILDTVCLYSSEMKAVDT